MNDDCRLYPILLAEDDLISRRLCKKMLAREGFAGITAANGREALESTPIETSGKTIGITSSFGVACFSPGTCKETITPEALLQEADNRLLQRWGSHGKDGRALGIRQ